MHPWCRQPLAWCRLPGLKPHGCLAHGGVCAAVVAAHNFLSGRSVRELEAYSGPVGNGLLRWPHGASRWAQRAVLGRWMLALLHGNALGHTL